MYRVWGREQSYTRFWFENLKERNQLVAPGVDDMLILRWIFRKWNFGVLTGCRWLRIGTVGGHL